jgi:tetratricopeptide (TPR) repeat protein
MNNRAVQSYLSSLATIVISVVFLLFPIFFLTTTTDFFTFPKQVLVVVGSLILFILWGIKAVTDKKVTFLTNPLNLPVFLFVLVVALSTVFSLSVQDSLLQSVPVILLGIFFYGVINFIQEKSAFSIALTALIIGSILSGLLSIFSQFQIYVLPFPEVKSTLFNTLGAQVQYIAFLTPLLVLCVASIINTVREKKISGLTKHYANILQVVAAIVFAVAIVIVFYQIFTSAQKPTLLPFNYGFQIAFATISQDASRLAQSLLLGSGYGTFSSDFTRFVAPSFNSYSFWNLTFSFSSSYILELLATTGVLGLFSFAFMFVNFARSRGKNYTNPLFISIFVVFILSLIIPFSYSLVFLLFGLLALYVSHRSIERAHNFEMINLNFVALKQGLISVSEDTPRSKKEGYILPVIVLVIAVLVAIYVLFYLTGSGSTPRKGYAQLVGSDMKFAKSFTPQALQSGSETYNLQTQSITEYPYRSDYYRLFSQINLALAANLVQAQHGASPSAQVQQNIIGLLQQSINSARQAVTLSPLSAANWQNLGQVYRNLIGVGQNADQFAIASYNQAIQLEPSNPGLRIELGGIYYQLQQWDLAQTQFATATQLKPDYANAYYNLGKTLEQKGDLQNALSEFQTVKQLVANDKANLKVINDEIKTVEDKLGSQKTQTGQEPTQNPTSDNTPLQVNQPTTQLPTITPEVKIQQPPITPTTTPTETPASESAK